MFDFDHVLNAVNLVLGKAVTRRRVTVVLWGHKNQGKSQVLHFLMTFLVKLGEFVVYLDSSAVPDPETKEVTSIPDLSFALSACLEGWRQCGQDLEGDDEELRKKKEEIRDCAQSMETFRTTGTKRTCSRW